MDGGFGFISFVQIYIWDKWAIFLFVWSTTAFHSVVFSFKKQAGSIRYPLSLWNEVIGLGRAWTGAQHIDMSLPCCARVCVGNWRSESWRDSDKDRQSLPLCLSPGPSLLSLSQTTKEPGWKLFFYPDVTCKTHSWHSSDHRRNNNITRPGHVSSTSASARRLRQRWAERNMIFFLSYVGHLKQFLKRSFSIKHKSKEGHLVKESIHAYPRRCLQKSQMRNLTV